MSGEWGGQPSPWNVPAPPPPPAPPAVSAPTPPPPPWAVGMPTSTNGSVPLPPAPMRRRVRPEPVGRPPRLRAIYAALAIVGLVAVGVVGGLLGPAVSAELRDLEDRADADRVAVACRTERRVIQTAEALYRRDHPAFGGVYTDMAGLVASGHLTRPSTRYAVDLADPPVSFSLRPLGECR